MRIQLHNNALRLSRYAIAAWTHFAVSYLLWSLDPAVFGLSTRVHDLLTYSMAAGFAVGCLFMAGTAGVRAFSRVTPY